MILDTCEWSPPGQNRFYGDQIEAIERYKLPPDIRKQLVIKIKARKYDDLVEITKDSIRGYKGTLYSPEIKQMNFGLDKVCRKVTRKSWDDSTRLSGMVYCLPDFPTCVVIPAICGNVSLIDKKPSQVRGSALAASYPVPTEPEAVIKFIPPATPDSPPDASLPPTGIITFPPSYYGLYPPGFFNGPYTPSIKLIPAPIPQLPEPGTFWCTLAGLSGLAWQSIKRRNLV